MRKDREVGVFTLAILFADAILSACLVCKVCFLTIGICSCAGESKLVLSDLV